MASPPPARRRRLDEREAKDTSGRTGCLVTGAVLGVIVGIMFALYGLPPILRSIYGETTVAPSEAYTEDAKRLAVRDVERMTVDGRELVVVTLDARTNKTWRADHTSWTLELDGVDGWVEALPADPDEPETSFDFTLGQGRTLVLRFPAPEGTPEALHLADPRVKFELQE